MELETQPTKSLIAKTNQMEAKHTIMFLTMITAQASLEKIKDRIMANIRYFLLMETISFHHNRSMIGHTPHLLT